MAPISTLILLCLAASMGFAQARYTVSDEDAAGPGTPKVVVLRDAVEGVEAAVAPSKGGELSSFRVKFKGEWVELLYHARDYTDTKGFQGKGPCLMAGSRRPVCRVAVSRIHLRRWFLSVGR